MDLGSFLMVANTPAQGPDDTLSTTGHGVNGKDQEKTSPGGSPTSASSTVVEPLKEIFNLVTELAIVQQRTQQDLSGVTLSQKSLEGGMKEVRQLLAAIVPKSPVGGTAITDSEAPGTLSTRSGESANGSRKSGMQVGWRDQLEDARELKGPVAATEGSEASKVTLKGDVDEVPSPGGSGSEENDEGEESRAIPSILSRLSTAGMACVYEHTMNDFAVTMEDLQHAAGALCFRLGVAGYGASLSEREGSIEAHPGPTWTVIEPDSRLRVFLDLFSMLVLIYDLIVLPIELAWHLPLDGALKVCTLFVAVWWSLDIVLNFRTAVHVDGVVERRASVIAKHYLQDDWFFIDLFVLICDYLFIVSELAFGGDTGLGISVLIKIGKVLRLFGTLRFVRLWTKISRMSDRSLSVHADVTFQTCKLVLVVLWLNHVVCCAWYAIGESEWSDTGYSWVTLSIGGSHSVDEEPRTYLDSGFLYQYTTALHWSFTQMTPGTIQVDPMNSFERAFNILCKLLAISLFGSLVSAVTARTTQLRLLQQEQIHQQDMLRRYLRQKGVSSQLAVALQKQVHSRLSSPKLLSFHDVTCLGSVSLSLKTELLQELVMPHLVQHPLFRLWSESDVTGMRRVILEALKFVSLRATDHLFLEGSEATHCYILSQGRLSYKQQNGHRHSSINLGSSLTLPMSPSKKPSGTSFFPFSKLLKKPEDHEDLNESRSEELQTEINPGDWLAEAALWVKWRHCGTAEARTASEVFSICPHKMKEIVTERGMTTAEAFRSVVLEYGLNFHARAGAAENRRKGRISDIEVPFGLNDMILRMRKNTRVLASIAALEVCRKARGVFEAHAPLVKMLDQVKEGKSTLTVTDGGEVQRIVPLAVLELERPDGTILVKLGKWDMGECKAKADFGLPGSKQSDGETPIDAVMRVLKGELALLVHESGGLQGPVMEVRREDKWQVSSSAEVKTRYMKTIHRAVLAKIVDIEHAGGTLNANEPGVTSTSSQTHEAALEAVRNKRTKDSRRDSYHSAAAARNLGRGGKGARAAFAARSAMSKTTLFTSEAQDGLELLPYEAFLIIDGMPPGGGGGEVPMEKLKVLIYAWCTPQEYSELEGPSGQANLKARLQRLHVRQDAIEEVCDRYKLMEPEPVTSDGQQTL